VIAVLILIGAVSLRILDPAPLQFARLKMFDLYQAAKPRVVEQHPVLIVDLDEKSIKAVGQWPWPRTVLADLVLRLRELGAKAIGFDVLFAEADRMSPRSVADTLRQADPALLSNLRSLPDNEFYFRDAIEGGSVVLGQAGHYEQTARQPNASYPSTPVAIKGGDPRNFLIDFPGLLRNVPELEGAAAGRGLFTIKPEFDGIIRRVPLVVSAESKVMPSLSLEMLRLAADASSVRVLVDQAGVKGVSVGRLEIPTDQAGHVWLRYSHRDPRRYVSAVDVLQGTVPANRIKGSLALIGTSAVGLFDLRSTPIDPVMPGVEIHAQLIENVLANSALHRPHYVDAVELALAIVVGLLTIYFVPKLGAVRVLAFGGILAALLAAASWLLFDLKGVLIDVMFPLASSFALFLLLTFMNYMREERTKGEIRAAFGQYLSPDLVSELVQNPERLQLGGETRELTILFSDVRGFTTIAETYKENPAGLTALMNRFLTPLSNAIISRRGTIDKYIGDAVMAFWNAPLEDRDHATHAVDAALEMLKSVEALNVRREAEALKAQVPFIRMEIGIGISTGPTMVGNMGSDIRFDYSVMGDKVNLASRLEGLTSSYGVRVLICPDTARQCMEQFAMLEIDTVRVKGKREAVTIWTVLGDQQTLQSADFRLFRGLFHQFREFYRDSNWKEAQSFLARSRRTIGAIPVSNVLDLYEQRLKELEKGNHNRSWDGVYQSRSDSTENLQNRNPTV
jgi:adenylate cyclase